MSTATLMSQPKIQFFGNDGKPLSGGKLYTWQAGTNIPKPTYPSSTMQSENTNPVILDSAGRARIWLDTSQTLYQMMLTDANDVEIWTEDNIAGIGATGVITSPALPWVDAKDYNSLFDAIAYIGGAKTTLVISTAVNCNSLTIPANISLWIMETGTISVSAGNVLTINGSFEAGNYVCFTGLGSVKFGPNAVHYALPDWWLSNDTPGTTDMSSAVLAATQSLAGTVKFLGNAYRFSINLTPANQAVCWEGQGYESGSWTNSTILYPLDATHPCFILNLNMPASTGYPSIMSPKFKRLKFAGLNGTNPTTRLGCGIWSRVALTIDECSFEYLKYGIIGNACEWSRIDRSYFVWDEFGVFATTSSAANDPMGITTNVDGNPSEWYFNNCYFNSCNTGYYEDQPDNQWDQTTSVRFENTQFMTSSGIPTAYIVLIGSHGSIDFKKCWWEGFGATNTDVTVRGKVIPASIVYSEGPCVIFDDCLGLYYTNRVFVKFSSAPVGVHGGPGPTSAYRYPPMLKIINCVLGAGWAGVGDPSVDQFVLDDGVISVVKETATYNNGGSNLSSVSSVDNCWPMLGHQSIGGGGLIFRSPSLPIKRLSSGGALINQWVGGTCAGANVTTYGAGVTQAITAGSGFIDIGAGSKFNRIVMPDNQGIQAAYPTFTTKTNYWYVLSFGIRQNSGSGKKLIVFAAGASYSPTQIGWINVPGDNEWNFYTGLAGCETGGSPAALIICNQNNSTSMTFDFSAIQVVEFKKLSDAWQFIRSGVYVDPVTL